MKLTVLGASTACPNPGGASAGYLVESASQQLLVDCGHGVASVLQTVADLSQISAIVISHMHPDHFFDLIPLKYCINFRDVPPIPLFLPPDGEAVLRRLQLAVPLGETFYADSYVLHEYEPARGLDVAGFHIQFSLTQHYIPAYAMRFAEQDHPGTLFYSSDTAWTRPLTDLARGADLGLIEATLLEEPEEVEPGHLTARRAGELAREAGIGRLLLTHYWQPYARSVKEDAESGFRGPVELAEQRHTYVVSGED